MVAKMKREFGPSQSQEMIRGLVEAARQLQDEERGVLKLTPKDEGFLKQVGVKSEKRRGESGNHEQILHKPSR
jgi:hypothetical protein